jgi:hypothetical protein
MLTVSLFSVDYLVSLKKKSLKQNQSLRVREIERKEREERERDR